MSSVAKSGELQEGIKRVGLTDLGVAPGEDTQFDLAGTWSNSTLPGMADLPARLPRNRMTRIPHATEAMLSLT